jgi:hypothetical protein
MPSAAKSRLSKAFSTRPLQHDGFSDLAKNEPISSQDFQRYGTLNVGGTSTKKRESTTDVQGLEKKAQEEVKPTIAYWSSETGKNDGRATLRRELDDEHLA